MIKHDNYLLLDITNTDNGTKELAGKSRIDQNCKKVKVCLNVEEFHEFFNSAHLAIQREQDHSKAKVYQQ